MTVISDINLICIEQKVKKDKEFANDFIDVECKKNPHCYYFEWEILSSIRGMWYQITPKARDLGVYSNEFFDLYYNRHKSYVVVNETKVNIDFIQNLLEFYLNESPINKVCLMIRLDYQKNQKIKGVIKIKEFLKKLSNNQILFDTAYIIEK